MAGISFQDSVYATVTLLWQAAANVVRVSHVGDGDVAAAIDLSNCHRHVASGHTTTIYDTKQRL